MKQNFYGGAYPNDRKELARHERAAPLGTTPKQVVITVVMYVGAPYKPIVAVDDQVKMGQKIGEIADLGAPVHASVPSAARAVEPRPYVGDGKVTSVVVESDFQNIWGSVLTPHPDYSELSYKEIVEIAKEAGITGVGGTGLPTHVKISFDIGKVDALILNGTECEPYTTADHRLILEQGERVIGGMRVLMQAFGLKSAVTGVGANKRDAIEHLKTLVGGKNDVQVEFLRTRYPQGAEKQLAQRITGREVPPGGLLVHVGCAAFNVGTAAAMYDAVVEGKPLTHRILTITGDAIKESKNLLMSLGTSFQQIINEGKGFEEEPNRVLTDSPITSIAQYNLDVACIKGINAALCLTKKETAPVMEGKVCLHCGRCVNVYLMHLTPIYIHLYAEGGTQKEAEVLSIVDYIEYGSCNYICPAHLHLVQSFHVTRGELRALAAKKKAAREVAKA